MPYDVTTFLDALDRAHKGPICTEKEWDVRVIPGAIAKALKKYELNGTYYPKNPINTDDELADRFYQAGLDVAVDTGLLCLSTERIIKFSRGEILHFAGTREKPGNLPGHVVLGMGRDGRNAWARRPEDPRPPITALGAQGTVVDEEIYVPVMMSHGQNYWSVDGTVPASLDRVYGRELRTGTPYETLGGWQESRLIKEAWVRVGRPGMFAHAPTTGPTELGYFGGLNVPGGLDTQQLVVPHLIPSELKVDYHLLQKAVASMKAGAHATSSHWAIIGGFAGGVEGAAVSEIAFQFLLPMVVRNTVTTACQIYSSQYFGNVGRDAVWACSVAQQAITRNRCIILAQVCNPTAGSLTESILREVTVIALSATTSGVGEILGVRTAGGRYPNRTSGVETGFVGEVIKCSAGMTREKANEIVNQLLPKYEDQLREPDIGVTFPECYDLKTIKPIKEWEAMYDKVKNEVAKLGVPFPY